jgi:hypothetical protein
MGTYLGVGVPAMSNASPADVDRESVGFDAETFQATVVPPVRFVGFWVAVLLPFAYVPLLFTGLEGATLTAFLALIAAHIVSLVLGNQYKQ